MKEPFLQFCISSTTLTVGFLLQDLRPHGQHGVDDDKPEGDQRDKVIELVRPVHHHTQNQDQEVQTEKHLGSRRIRTHTYR